MTKLRRNLEKKWKGKIPVKLESEKAGEEVQ